MTRQSVTRSIRKYAAALNWPEGDVERVLAGRTPKLPATCRLLGEVPQRVYQAVQKGTVLGMCRVPLTAQSDVVFFVVAKPTATREDSVNAVAAWNRHQPGLVAHLANPTPRAP